jgi:MtN3 and saliva related transmembrane protein
MDDLIGYAAGILGTAAFLPQVLKTVKSRRTQDISLGMYILFCSGVALWLIYGLRLGSMPVIAANAVTLALAGTVLVLKVRNG